MATYVEMFVAFLKSLLQDPAIRAALKKLLLRLVEIVIDLGLRSAAD